MQEAQRYIRPSSRATPATGDDLHLQADRNGFSEPPAPPCPRLFVELDCGRLESRPLKLLEQVRPLALAFFTTFFTPFSTDLDVFRYLDSPPVSPFVQLLVLDPRRGWRSSPRVFASKRVVPFVASLRASHLPAIHFDD